MFINKFYYTIFKTYGHHCEKVINFDEQFNSNMEMQNGLDYKELLATLCSVGIYTSFGFVTTSKKCHLHGIVLI